jgi:hypothetical protein
VRIVTEFPNPQMWEKVSYIAIMSEAWASAHGAWVPANVSAGEENHASRHANGTGPFILKEFEPAGPVVMVRKRAGGVSSTTRTMSIASSTPRSPTARAPGRVAPRATSTC